MEFSITQEKFKNIPRVIAIPRVIKNTWKMEKELPLKWELEILKWLGCQSCEQLLKLFNEAWPTRTNKNDELQSNEM